MAAKKVIHFIEWTLAGRVNPLVYLVTYSSFAIGFFFTFLTHLPDVENTLLYKYGLLVDTNLWGILLLISSALLFYGLKQKMCKIVQIGAWGNFIAWIFAGIMYAENQFWYALFTFAIFQILCFGYIYLAAALDKLWLDDQHYYS